MKPFKLFFIALVALTLFSSCSKNDDDTQPVEAEPQFPMKTLLEIGPMELTDTVTDLDSFIELGYEFKAFKNGKITALGVRIPNNGEFRVTLWNSVTEEILATQMVTSTSGLLSFEDIAPIHINSGTRYLVSVNTNSYYFFYDSGEIVFPAEADDFIITTCAYTYGADQNFPSVTVSDQYAGMVDIKFVPEN
ncbi:DUF4082 domain-containing protein [Hyunsoonleella rubra]|uniref:DUF4082 domain-containing protein n=1 Tax=Hyunsoonleella rubra TaxID=1737062 RepID=A0ABW5T9T1_9FLAO